MGIGAGFYMYDVVVEKFTFAISSPDEFLFSTYWYRHLIASQARRLLIMLIFVGLKIVKMRRFICCSVT